jgi:hypothetical protein
MNLLRHAAKTAVNTALGVVGLKLARSGAPFQESKDYIPFRETMREAKAAHLSVGDFVEQKYNEPGTPKFTIDQMRALGAFDGRMERVVEIGPGTGRYLERVLEGYKPSSYEIYETARDWERYLCRTYPVVSHPCDGRTLSATPSRSVDLVQTHKVLCGQASLATCRYLNEMARVVRDGGRVVFDVVTETCFDDETVEHWLTTGSGYQHYPNLVPRQYVIDLMGRRGLGLLGSFLVPMAPGLTECMVFRWAVSAAELLIG